MKGRVEISSSGSDGVPVVVSPAKTIFNLCLYPQAPKPKIDSGPDCAEFYSAIPKSGVSAEMSVNVNLQTSTTPVSA